MEVMQLQKSLFPAINQPTGSTQIALKRIAFASDVL
jgi:hypothetical protein